jgi:dipeptidyl aminopeptidase/acylaminoacyl peptidase
MGAIARQVRDVLAATCAAALLASPAQAAFPGANGLIVHFYSHAETFEAGERCHMSPALECHGRVGFRPFVERLAPEGSIVSRTALPAFGGAVSPDGRRLALSRRTGGIVVSDLTGQHVRRVSRGHGDFSPAWSADGREIAFLRSTSDSTALSVVNSRGGHVRRLASGFIQEAPTWSPDGDRVAYLRPAGRGQRCPGKATVWIVDARGGPARRLYRPGFGCRTVGAIDWAPDGDRLVIWLGRAHGDPKGVPSIPSSKAVQPGLSILSETGRIRHVRYEGAYPVWSPNGDWLAFTGQCVPGMPAIPFGFPVCAIRPDGSGGHGLGFLTSETGGQQQFTWVPGPRTRGLVG